MRGLLHQHAHAFELAVRRLGATPFAHLLTVVVIGLSLALPSVLFRIVADVAALARIQAGPPQLTVFMHADAGDNEVQALQQALARRPDVAAVRFVPPAQALKEIQQRMGLDDVLAGLDHNPLPPAFLVRPSAGQPAQLAALQAALRDLPAVELVQLDSEWARRLYALGAFLQRGVLLLAAVLGAGVITLVVNTIRLQIAGAREELEVCKLLGASDAFVRRPFLYFGMMQMLLGAGLALALAEGARHALNQVSREVLGAYGLYFQLQPPAPIEYGSVLGFAVLSGWVAAAGAMAIFLRALRPR